MSEPLTPDQVREALDEALNAIVCDRGPGERADRATETLRRLLESGFPMPPAVRAVCEEMRLGYYAISPEKLEDWLKRIEEAYE